MIRAEPGRDASRRLCRILLVCCILTIAACASVPTPAQRRAYTDALTNARGWTGRTLQAGAFQVFTYAPDPARAADALTLYIEGDGFAWTTPSMPSADPTPREPLALKLALAHPNGSAAYLARPCQYVGAGTPACPVRYWTHARFAPEVLQAENLAVDELKARFGARELVLVGFSGGGAVAALLAARRRDVRKLITVAGNLDHAAWTQHHRMLPLTDSLNASDVSAQLRAMPQTHFVGGNDRVIPPALARAFSRDFIGAGGANLRVIEGFDHHCCWAQRWPALWGEANRPDHGAVGVSALRAPFTF